MRKLLPDSIRKEIRQDVVAGFTPKQISLKYKIPYKNAYTYFCNGNYKADNYKPDIESLSLRNKQLKKLIDGIEEGQLFKGKKIIKKYEKYMLLEDRTTVMYVDIMCSVVGHLIKSRTIMKRKVV